MAPELPPSASPRSLPPGSPFSSPREPAAPTSGSPRPDSSSTLPCDQASPTPSLGPFLHRRLPDPENQLPAPEDQLPDHPPEYRRYSTTQNLGVLEPGTDVHPPTHISGEQTGSDDQRVSDSTTRDSTGERPHVPPVDLAGIRQDQVLPSFPDGFGSAPTNADDPTPLEAPPRHELRGLRDLARFCVHGPGAEHMGFGGQNNREPPPFGCGCEGQNTPQPSTLTQQEQPDWQKTGQRWREATAESSDTEDEQPVGLPRTIRSGKRRRHSSDQGGREADRNAKRRKRSG